MNNLKLQIGIGVLIVFLGGSALIALRSPNIVDTKTPLQVGGNAVVPTTGTTPTSSPKPTPTPTPKPTPVPVPKPAPTPTPIPTVKSYSLSEVAQHNDSSSCWTAISGNVYDLTPFIRQHPGGSRAILSLCGIDGTSAFLAQHAGQRNPQAELQTLFIGKLK